MLAIFIDQSNAKDIIKKSVYFQEMPACHFRSKGSEGSLYPSQQLYVLGSQI